MKIYFGLFYLILIIPLHAMQQSLSSKKRSHKNWVPILSNIGESQYVVWKGSDAQELITIRYNRTKKEYSGAITKYSNPTKSLPLSREEVEDYLVELNEITPPVRLKKINLRDL